VPVVASLVASAPATSETRTARSGNRVHPARRILEGLVGVQINDGEPMAARLLLR
jgi:hypothetical protein